MLLAPPPQPPLLPDERCAGPTALYCPPWSSGYQLRFAVLAANSTSHQLQIAGEVGSQTGATIHKVPPEEWLTFYNNESGFCVLPLTMPLSLVFGNTLQMGATSMQGIA